MSKDYDFTDVEVYDGINQQQAMVPAQSQAPTALAAIEQSRAVAEVQASLVIARANPRDEDSAYLRIMKACKRPSLAEGATYAFKRGTSLISGPTIRLAEVFLRCWGNATAGFREIGRGLDYSEVEAFAHDLETNTRFTRQFQVRHYRDKRQGPEKLEGERDKYEYIANQAQRRVRACIIELIPGDIVETAVKQCEDTLSGGDDRPIEDRVRAMIQAFDELGVTKEMIEGHLQHSLKAVVSAELVRLQQIYRSIRDGVASREDFFGPILKTAVAEEKPLEKPEKPESPPPPEPKVSPFITEEQKILLLGMCSDLDIDISDVMDRIGRKVVGKIRSDEFEDVLETVREMSKEGSPPPEPGDGDGEWDKLNFPDWVRDIASIEAGPDDEVGETTFSATFRDRVTSISYEAAVRFTDLIDAIPVRYQSQLDALVAEASARWDEFEAYLKSGRFGS